MNKVLIAQIIAVAIILANIIANQQTKKKNLLILNGLSNVLSATQYILLGAYTGCISCLVAVLRNIIFASFKNKKIPFYVLLIYWCIAILMNYKFINGLLSIIPVFNICLYGFAIWQNDMKVQKKSSILIDILAIIYDYTNKAYVVILNEALDMISSYIAYIRIKLEEEKKKKRKKKKIKTTRK